MAILSDLTERMLNGDVERGRAWLNRLAHLAATTDKMQLFMFQRETLLPQDARDLFAYFAANGVVLTAWDAAGEEG